MTRADAWIRFAAAAEAGRLGPLSAGDAASMADNLLEEFDKRFEPVPYGFGQAPSNSAPDTFQARKTDDPR